MNYGSICSGIEAVSVAVEPLGWTPKFFAEIDKFPSAVLAHRYPYVPNLGDFTRIGAEHGPVDVLFGGTPCQDFSITGKRAGLDGARGNLTLEFLRLADRLRPWGLVWENVVGAMLGEGRPLGAFLGGLAELGYGFAYRVLDAQFFGVPISRRRVFVVAYSGGDWRRAAAVLFEPESLSGNPGKNSQTRGGGVLHCLTRHGYGACREEESYIAEKDRIRRMTPNEMERCMGFPVNWTNVPGASATSRGMALGNSMAVPVIRWIAERIQLVDSIPTQGAGA